MQYIFELLCAVTYYKMLRNNLKNYEKKNNCLQTDVIITRTGSYWMWILEDLEGLVNLKLRVIVVFILVLYYRG